MICFVHIFVENLVFSQEIFGAQARFAETEIFFEALSLAPPKSTPPWCHWSPLEWNFSAFIN